MGKNGKEKGQELNGKKMELNGGKWERQWRICEFALFEKNEDIWVCPVTDIKQTSRAPAFEVCFASRGMLTKPK